MEDIVSNTKKSESNFSAELYDWTESIVFALAAVVLVFTFLFRTVGVEGFSMQNTLQDGDKVIIEDFNYSPKQGDIVAINSRGLDEPIIKRVAAVGGQTVDIDYAKGKVYVDGKEFKAPIKEKMIDPQNGHQKLKLPLKVPAGCIFAMGDNRNISLDSRYAVVGVINDKDIIGHAVFRLFPFNKIGNLH